MDKIEIFLDVTAEHHADLDFMVSERQEAYRDRLEVLLFDPEARDEGIFEQLQIPIEITIDALGQVPVHQRNLDWVTTFAEILSACKIQAFIELFDVGFLELAERGGKNMNSAAKEMSINDLKTASGKKDIKTRITKVRQTKYGFK